MRRILIGLCFVALAAAAASAQGKVDSGWNCGKGTSEHTLPVGDKPDHAYSISQFTCTATKGEVGGVKHQDGAGTEFRETSATSMDSHGVFIETLANADKIYIKYTGKATLQAGQVQGMITDTWTITGGTGKFANAKGNGTCSGKMNADGTSAWTCQGTYTGVK